MKLKVHEFLKGKNNAMSKKLYYLIALLSITAVSNAQTYAWTKTIGGTNTDDGYAVTTDSDGNIYITGSYSDSVDFDPSPSTAYLMSNGGIDIYLAKYDQNGNYIWAKSIGDTSIEYPLSITLDQSNNILITGAYYAYCDFDPSASTAFLTGADSMYNGFVAKYTENGDYLWAIPFKGTEDDLTTTIAVDEYGNVYATGCFADTIDIDPSPGIHTLISNGGRDAFLAKFDQNGNYLWAFNIGNVNNDISKSVLTDTMHHVYLTGILKGTLDLDPSSSVFPITSPSGTISYIAKYDDAGNFIWAKGIGSEGNYMAFDHSGNICIVGNYKTTRDFDPGPSTYNLTSAGFDDIAFAKYDTSGNFIWAKSVGGTSTDQPYAIAIDNSSNIYLTGTYRNTADFDPGTPTVNLTATGTGLDVFIAKYDASGNYLSAKKVGGPLDDVAYGINISTSNDLYITGYFNGTTDFNPDTPIENHSSNGYDDIFLMKFANPTTSIESIQIVDLSSFKIYPNPTNNTLFCETSQNTQVYIYNSSGAMVFNQQLNSGKHSLDISFLVPGIYLVRSDQEQRGLVFFKQ